MTTPRIRRVPPRRSDAADLAGARRQDTSGNTRHPKFTRIVRDDQGAKSFFVQLTVFQQSHRWSAHSSLSEAERSAEELRLQGFHAIARGSAL